MAKNRVQVQGVSAPKLGNSIGGMGQTFINPDQSKSNRGSQIAKALQNVGGLVSTIAEQKVAEQVEEVRLVDGIKAKNAYGVLSPSLVEHMKNQDYSITEREDGTRRRATADEMFSSWSNTEEYQGQLSQFGSESAKRAFEGSMAQAVAETYGTSAVDFDQREMRETFSQELQVSIANGTPNAWDSYDSRLVDTGLMSRPEAMSQIQSDAEHMYSTTGDASGFDYMEAQGMGNNEFKKANESKRDAIANNIAITNDRARKKMINQRTDTKVDLMTQVATRLREDPYADLGDLEDKALEAGIPSFRGDTETLRKNYGKSTGEFKMANNDKVSMYEGLAKLPTKEKRMAYLQENASQIDSSTFGTWLGYINSGSIPNFRDGEEYKAVSKTLDQLLDAEFLGEAFVDVKGHLDYIFYEGTQNEKWANADPDERQIISQNWVEIAKTRAGVGEGQSNEAQNVPLDAAKKAMEAQEAKDAEAAEAKAKADADNKQLQAQKKRLEELEAQYNK